MLTFSLLLLLLIDAVQLSSAKTSNAEQQGSGCTNYILEYNDFERNVTVLDGIVAQLAYTTLAEDNSSGPDQQV